ncbi:MAG: SDR family NAD(P)-dependent oxidoreductase [Gemmatimonadota bacterium]
MSIELQNRVALVTGGVQGIGRAVAERLLEGGASVAINDIDRGRVETVTRQLGPNTLAVPGDVTDRDLVHAMVRETVARWGRLDILVTAAGILFPTRFADIEEREWQRTFDVNVTAVFLCMQAAAVAMKGHAYGRIVNLSSTAGKSVSTLGGAHYTASKAAVLGLTRAAAKELAGDGITVNSVCPGLIDTEMVQTNVTPDRLAAYRAHFPIQRLGAPREVADLIAFLASEQAGYITGASFDINGGDLMI